MYILLLFELLLHFLALSVRDHAFLFICLEFTLSVRVLSLLLILMLEFGGPAGGRVNYNIFAQID